MVDLRDVQTGLVMGRIREDQLQLLIDALEEERRYDRDYYLDAATVDLLASRGADEELLATLRGALVGRTSIELEWSRREDVDDADEDHADEADADGGGTSR